MARLCKYSPCPRSQAVLHLNQSGTVRTVNAGPPAPHLSGYYYTITTYNPESPWPYGQYEGRGKPSVFRCNALEHLFTTRRLTFQILRSRCSPTDSTQ